MNLSVVPSSLPNLLHFSEVFSGMCLCMYEHIHKNTTYAYAHTLIPPAC